MKSYVRDVLLAQGQASKAADPKSTTCNPVMCRGPHRLWTTAEAAVFSQLRNMAGRTPAQGAAHGCPKAAQQPAGRKAPYMSARMASLGQSHTSTPPKPGPGARLSLSCMGPEHPLHQTQQPSKSMHAATTNITTSSTSHIITQPPTSPSCRSIHCTLPSACPKLPAAANAAMCCASSCCCAAWPLAADAEGDCAADPAAEVPAPICDAYSAAAAAAASRGCPAAPACICEWPPPPWWW